MGGHDYGRSNIYNEPTPTVQTKSERLVELIGSECGLHTLYILTKGGFCDIEEYVEGKTKTWLKSMESMVKEAKGGKLTFIDLLTFLKAHDKTKSPDLRYNSDRRHFQGDIFHESVKTGFVALKFEGDNSTHWCPIIDGEIGIDYGNYWVRTVDEVKESYPSFDGFTQCAMFLGEEDENMIKNLYSQPCKKEHCEFCLRSKYCRVKPCACNDQRLMRSIDV